LHQNDASWDSPGFYLSQDEIHLEIQQSLAQAKA